MSRKPSKTKSHPKSAKPPTNGALLENAAKDLEEGRAAAVETALKSVVAEADPPAESLRLMGLAVLRQGRVEEAATWLDKALDRDPDNLACRVARAVIHMTWGDAATAESECRAVLAVDAERADAQAVLAGSLEAQGRLEDAEEAWRGCIATADAEFRTYLALGDVLRRQGKLDPAIQIYNESARLWNTEPEVWAALGSAWLEQGNIKDAHRSCKYAVHLAADFGPGHIGLGNVLVAQGDIDGAITCYLRALEIDADDIPARLDLGAALARKGDMATALEAYSEVVARQPERGEAHNGLGVVSLALGHLEEAATCFRRAVTARPTDAEAWYNLAGLGVDLGLADLALIERALGDELTPADDRLKLHFAMGTALDRRAMATEAFPHFRDGNALRRAALDRAGQGFDADAHDRFVDHIIEVFDAKFFADRNGFGTTTKKLVFVVGMPRSGTTLVEQILASHPDAIGVGEPDAVAAVADGLGDSFPRSALDLDKARAIEIGTDYLSALEAARGGSARIVDKTPRNFIFLGLIALLLPGARVIHCRRDARDVGLSAYFQNFVAGQAWSTDLTDIGRYLRAYRSLMAHWREALPVPEFDIEYESLVAAPETQVRRLLDYVGLPWDEACLRFHETERTVLSASAAQVRRPFYGGAVGRWRAYEDPLRPLLSILDDD